MINPKRKCGANSVSIIIPTYNDPQSFERALTSSIEQENINKTIIVSDDSTNNLIYNIVKLKQNEGFNRIYYYKHDRTKKASDNWNYGLSLAKSDYIILMHHDEFFMDSLALSRGVEKLKGRSNCIFIFGLAVEKGTTNKKRNYIYLLLVKYFLSILYFVNIVGPVSTILFQKNNLNYFNTSLVWLVDIDWMYKSFHKCEILYSKGIDVGSCQTNDSITNSIDTISIERKEISYLLKEDNNLLIKINLLLRRSYRVIPKKFSSYLRRVVWK